MKVLRVIILTLTVLGMASCVKGPYRSTPDGMTVSTPGNSTVRVTVIDEKIIAASLLTSGTHELPALPEAAQGTPFDIDYAADSTICLYTRLAAVNVDPATARLTFADSAGNPLLTINPLTRSTSLLPRLATGVEILLAQNDQTVMDYTTVATSDTTLTLPEPYIATDGYNILCLDAQPDPVYVVVFGEDVNLFRNKP